MKPEIINFREDSLIKDLVQVDSSLKNKLLMQVERFKSSIGKDAWFWQKVQDSMSMDLLNLIETTNSIDKVALALLETFKAPCTRNSLITILRSVFGDNSLIDIQSPQAGVLDFNITIDPSVLKFFNFFSDEEGNHLVDENDFNLVFQDTHSLGFFGDTKSFLEIFVAEGVSIRNINMS